MVCTPIAGQPALRSLAQCPVEYHRLFPSYYKPSHRDFPQRELTHNYCYRRGYRCLKKSVPQKEGQNDTGQPGLLRWYGKPLIGYAHGGYTSL